MRVNVNVAVQGGNGGGFTGLGMVVGSRFTNYMPEVREGQKFEPKPKFVYELTIQELDSELQATGDQKIVRVSCGGKALEPITFEGEALPWRMCPGVITHRDDLEDQPLGTELNVDGNCLSCAHAKFGLSNATPFFMYGESLRAAGASESAVGNFFAGEWIGMTARFETVKHSVESTKKKLKADGTQEEDVVYDVLKVTEILELPNCPDWTGAPVAQAAPVAAPAIKGTAVAVAAPAAPKPVAAVARPAAPVAGRPVTPVAAKPVTAAVARPAVAAAPVAATVTHQAPTEDDGVAFSQVLFGALGLDKFVAGTVYTPATFKVTLMTALVNIPSIPATQRVAVGRSVNTMLTSSWGDILGQLAELTGGRLAADEAGNVVCVY